jgi:hypothetical protein
MAITPGYVGSAGITWSASATASVAGQSIGTATWDRIVVVAVTIEDNVTINSCTIGGVAANQAISVTNTTGTPDNACAFFWLPVPTGTTATIAVTLSASSSLAGRISVWATTGAYPSLFDSNSAQGAGTTQTLTGVTINTNGAGYWVFNNATAATATAWTNATSRDDTATATYRHSVADSTTAGTATITADGATANQILAGISFNENPPAMGWDTLPQFDKARQSVRPAAIALAASGAILSPYPYFQAPIPDFAHAQTTTNYAFAKTLYYQAKIAPPPQEPPVVPAPPFGWHQALSRAAPATKLRLSNLIHAPAPISQPYAVFDVQTTYLAVKVLQYQDRFETIAVADNTVTIDKWQQPLSRAVPRPPVYSALYTPFVPKEATSENTQTPDKWLQAWRGPPRTLLGLPGGSPFVPREAVLDNTVTPDAWMLPFQKAATPFHLNISDVTYAPTAPVVDNTVTIDKWQLTWNLAAPARKPIHTQPVFGYPYLSINNYRLEWDWYVQWKEPPRLWPLGKPYQPFIPAEAVRDNTQTPDKWLQAFKGPPRYQPVQSQWTPFVPREAVLDNTVTPDKWLLGFQRAFPTKPIHTQPVFGYPYVAAPNLTTTLEWMQAWQGPPRIRPAKTQVTYPVQPVVQVSNLTTTLEWMQAWKGPPRYRPVKTYYQSWSPQPLAAVVAAAYSQFTVHTAYLAKRSLQYQDTVYAFAPPPPPPVVVKFDIQTSFLHRRSLYYQDTVYAPQPPPAEVCVPAFQVTAFQTSAFQTCADIDIFGQNLSMGVTLSVEIHVCGWGEQGQQIDVSSVQGQDASAFVEQAESDDDYDEQEECGR